MAAAAFEPELAVRHRPPALVGTGVGLLLTAARPCRSCCLLQRPCLQTHERVGMGHVRGWRHQRTPRYVSSSSHLVAHWLLLLVLPITRLSLSHGWLSLGGVAAGHINLPAMKDGRVFLHDSYLPLSGNLTINGR